MRRLVVVCLAACSGLVAPAVAGRAAMSRGVIDLHVDLSYQLSYKQRPFSGGSGEYLADHLLDAGVSGVVLPLYVPKNVSPEGPRMQDLEASYERVVHAIRKTPPYAMPGCRYEVDRVRTFLSFEGAGPLAGHPEEVSRWVARGVRLFGLVHSYDNQLASSSGSRPPHAFGLTDDGHDLVRAVFRAGAVVDVSHASDRATGEILDIAEEMDGVVVASHSNARRLADHPRNLGDDLVRRIAATGGVIGVNFHSRFLVTSGRATLADVVRHVRHLTDVAGVDHVAIGSDYEGGIRPPRELADVRGFPALRDALIDAGLSRESVGKIFHDNALRVLCTLRPPQGASTP